MERVNVGIIGCGNISSNYLKNARSFPILNIARLADLDLDRAKAKAGEFNIPASGSVQDLLSDPTISLVINLTIPAAHAQVAKQCLDAGKHVYNEKPLAATVAEGRAIMQLAGQKNLRVGCAPDTFLGAGHQTARKLLDEQAIGTPVAALAFMMGRGHETWHPDPIFYYKPGGGPMFDMGPYYLTALIQMLGPIAQVTGMTSIAVPERTITSQPKFGTKITVETPDHVTGCLRFVSGAVATIVTSFATPHPVHDTTCPITIFGSEGALKVPDPNGFDGPVRLARGLGKEIQYETVLHTHVEGYGRSAGAADMARAIQTGRSHRASGNLGMAVLETMQGFLDASTQGKTISITAPHDRPAAMPTGLKLGEMD